MKTRRGAAKKVKRASEQTPDFRHRGKTSGGGHFQGASVFREMQAFFPSVSRLTLCAFAPFLRRPYIYIVLFSDPSLIRGNQAPRWREYSSGCSARLPRLLDVGEVSIVTAVVRSPFGVVTA